MAGEAGRVTTPGMSSVLRYGLSYQDVEELLDERRITVDHVTVTGGCSVVL
jgi:transposase-like protein